MGPVQRCPSLRVDGKSVRQSVSSTDDYGDGRWERVCSGRGGRDSGQGFSVWLCLHWNLDLVP